MLKKRTVSCRVRILLVYFFRGFVKRRTYVRENFLDEMLANNEIFLVYLVLFNLIDFNMTNKMNNENYLSSMTLLTARNTARIYKVGLVSYLLFPELVATR